MTRTGLWLIGAGGNVATTVALGLAALRRGRAAPLGLLTASPRLAGVDLLDWSTLVLGGHEIAAADPLARARGLAAEGLFPLALVDDVADDLAAFRAELRPGAPASSRPALAAVTDDLARFRDRHGLGRVVVVHLASTEAPWDAPPGLDLAPVDAAIAGGHAPASVLYARAALALGAAFVNFTPSTGSAVPALDALARARGAVHAGRDGKTGETLLKSALAPLFAARELRVRSWFGQNILGNGDGRALTDAARRASKRRSKAGVLPALLGYEPDAHVGIDYVAPLGDWKVAWDHILFEGFLGTRMTLQLTWQGADSILAAPLVLDLARLADRALRRGEVGLLGYLGLFFKEPLGARQEGLEHQLARLLDHLGCDGERDGGGAAAAGTPR